MEKMECPHCGSALGNGVAVCGECGRELDDHAAASDDTSSREEKRGRKNVYAILAVFLVVVGGAALLFITGLLPNPIKSGTTAAIVNGEKISTQDLDQKLEIFKKMSGQSGNMDFSSPQGKKALAGMKLQILQSMIQEKILVTEVAREKITVTQQEITDRISAVKKMLNVSDKAFEEFLKKHDMSLANFEKRMEKDASIEKLIAKATQEKGLTQEDWLKELNARAKVEILIK